MDTLILPPNYYRKERSSMFYLVRGTVRFIFYMMLLGFAIGIPHTIGGLLGGNG